MAVLTHIFGTAWLLQVAVLGGKKHMGTGEKWLTPFGVNIDGVKIWLGLTVISDALLRILAPYPLKAISSLWMRFLGYNMP
jgi:hypothetical protein